MSKADWRAGVFAVTEAAGHRAVGTAFLVQPRLAVTCAHVVAGRSVGAQVTLVNAQTGARCPAEITVLAGAADVAFLRLLPPLAEAIALPLAQSAGTDGHTFRAFGYPLDETFAGLWAQGQIVGPVVQAGGGSMLQLRSQEIARGMSGAPVWDEGLGMVVGMVTLTYQPPDGGKFRDAAWAVPTEGLDAAHPDGLRLMAAKAPKFAAPSAGARAALPPAQQARLDLLDRVESMWVKDVLDKSLYREVLIALGLAAQPGAVAHPWDMELQLPEQPARALPPGTRIETAFDELAGEMLILGEPGAGKTTMLLELARATIARARTDPTRPLPVYFNLAAWRPKPHPTLQSWLVAELTARYFVPPKQAAAWVAENALLYLLDGLDEVRAEDRAACAHALNVLRQAQGLRGALVVCCRASDYAALPERLKLRGALRVQPLTDAQITAYFDALGPELAGVRAAWEGDPVLQELTRQPLMLSILTLAYRGLPPEALREAEAPSLEARRKHLFDAYIVQMFARVARTQRQDYTLAQTTRWLTWLAQRLVEQGKEAFRLEEMGGEWLPTDAQQWLLLLIFLVLVIGLPGLVFALLAGLWGVVLGILGIFGPPLFLARFAVNLRLSLKNAVIVGLSVTAFGALVGGLFNQMAWGWVGGLSLGWGVVLYSDGWNALDHHTLRVFLALTGRGPWRYRRFLEFAVERTFLRKAGEGYLFVHRGLMEHIAALAPWPDYNQLGNAYSDLGRHEESLAAYQRAIALAPKDAAPYNGLGNVYRALGQHEQAIAAYQRAIELAPKDAIPHYNLGLVFLLRHQPEAALQAFEKAVALAPEDGACRSSLAGVLRRLGRTAEAEAQAALARPLMAQESDYNRACFAALCGEVDTALALLQAALEKRQVSKTWARQDPDLEALRGEGRFWELVNS